jgi:hypothetical protein
VFAKQFQETAIGLVMPISLNKIAQLPLDVCDISYFRFLLAKNQTNTTVTFHED